MKLFTACEHNISCADYLYLHRNGLLSLRICAVH